MRPALSTLFGRKDLVGVEIGVYTGLHAREILSEVNITLKKLYLVDPYVTYHENGKDFIQANDALYRLIDQEFAADPRVSIVRKHSVDASKDIEDGILDFVYIDGNHECSFVLLDIESWMPKLKKEGLMSGHDWNGEPGVNEAVTDYCKKNNITIEFGGPDWWFRK